nr:hypothetical protein [Tanacetum cinerariifolium]
PYQSSQYGSHAQSSTPLSITYPSNDFQSSVNHNVYNPSSSIPQVEYAPSVHQQSDFSQPDSGLIVPVFQKDHTHQDQVETIQGNKGLLSATTVKEKDTCQSNAQNQKEKRMMHGSRIRINSANIALMANLSHHGYDNLVE